MSGHHDSVWGAIAKAALWFAAWLGTINLADVHMAVSVLSGLLISALAALNFYITWRDKVARNERKARYESTTT